VVELSGGDGSGHEEALRLIAAEAGQRGVGQVGLDTVGDHAKAEAVSQVDGGGDQGGRAVALSHGEDERTVELELVDGQVAQVAQRAVAGAEIVYRDLDTTIPQPSQDGAGPVAVGHQELLGGLQLQGMGRDSPGAEHRGDLSGQVGVDQRAGREVDRHGQFLAVCVPARHLVQGLGEHHAGQRWHQPGLLDQGQEGVRVDQATGGVVPAHQGFDTVDFAAVQVDLGLVVQDELAGAQRGPQLLDGLQQGGVVGGAEPARPVRCPTEAVQGQAGYVGSGQQPHRPHEPRAESPARPRLHPSPPVARCAKRFIRASSNFGAHRSWPGREACNTAQMG